MTGGWFTVEPVDGETFAISEYRHWEETHCYLLLGRERALLIDTGLGVGDMGRTVRELTDLPVTAVTTHAHWDHIGGHRQFDSIGVHEAEAAWLSGAFPLPLAAVRAGLCREPCRFPPGFDPERFQLYAGGADFLLRDGDALDLGGRRVTVVHTPGHSPGHCCFYEPERGYLYAGDLLYLGCLDAFYPTTDPALFRQSVKKTLSLRADRVLPGHHGLELPPDLRERVDAAFDLLAAEGKLRRGRGRFDFGDFQIHV